MELLATVAYQGFSVLYPKGFWGWLCLIFHNVLSLAWPRPFQLAEGDAMRFGQQVVLLMLRILRRFLGWEGGVGERYEILRGLEDNFKFPEVLGAWISGFFLSRRGVGVGYISKTRTRRLLPLQIFWSPCETSHFSFSLLVMKRNRISSVYSLSLSTRIETSHLSFIWAQDVDTILYFPPLPNTHAHTHTPTTRQPQRSPRTL